MGDRELVGVEKIAAPFVREVTERFAHGAQLAGNRVTGALRADRQQVREPRALLSSWLCTALGSIAPHAPELVPVAGARTVELAGGRFRYQSTGTGDEALLFLHGFNSQLSIWNDVWPWLTGCGRSVRLDLAGYGGSDWRCSSYSLPAQAERVIRFMDAVGLARVTLVGVSMGGSLAAWIAAHRPDRVRGLVLLAPSGYPGALRYRGVFGALLGRGWRNRWATWLASTDRYRRAYPRSSALQALTVTASYGEPWARALANIRAHAWLVWSRGDACVPFSYARAVASAIPACTLVPLSGPVGHDIPGNRPTLIGMLARHVHRGTRPDHVRRKLDDILNRNGDA